MGTGLPFFSDHTASLHELKIEAGRCRTPRQFRKFLGNLRRVIPYDKLAGSWGYPSRTTIRFMFNEGFPTDLIRWRLTMGALWTSPAFQEWLRTKRTFLWCDAARRLKAQFDPELLRRMEQAGVQHLLCGGLISHDYFVAFAADMVSEENGHSHLEQFDLIVPWLVEASQRAYPGTILTKRETTILERRARGEITKNIAAAEKISERTVTMHLQHIKKKLYTDDLVNAVAIAVKGGIVLAPGRKEILE